MTDKVRTLLLDADIVAYKVAAKNEGRWDFNGDGKPAIHVEEERALEQLHEVVNDFGNVLKASRVVVCLSDPSGRYFRHDLLPSYKGNRDPAAKPQMLMELKGVLADHYETYQKPGLEADDAMGILATNTVLQKAKGYGEVIVVSDDKDMRTLPVKLFNPNKSDLGIIEVSELDADRFHLWQTIVGDKTDHYPGAPGVGDKSPYADEIVTAERDELWDIVLEAYASKGFTEEHAITQARMARILRSQDWNYQEQRPRLWSPVTLLGNYYENP